MEKEPELGWIAAIVQCDVCTYTWNAVYHGDCKKLQCPHCTELVNYTILQEIQ